MERETVMEMQKTSERTTIHLPQGTLDFHRPLPERARLLVLGGRAPAVPWLQEWRRAWPSADVYAVDHGVDACRRAGLSPTLLIGDADSATPENWRWGEARAARVERHPVEKDFTDTQLALRRAMEDGSAVLLLTGAFGGRFDHAYSTIFSAAQVQTPCVLADERELVVYVHGGERLTVAFRQQPKALSLLPMTAEAEGVTLQGTHWPLTDAVLCQGRPNAVSNVVEKSSKDCTLQVREGCIALYACFFPA
ncbi:MAG: thiamine diphosphokinase [Selenomonas sp.]